MNEPRHQNPTQSHSRHAGGCGAALTVGVLLIPSPPPARYLQWDNGHGINGIKATVTDIWSTTNFTQWTRIGSVTNTNIWLMPVTKPKEFFKVSHRINVTGHME